MGFFRRRRIDPAPDPFAVVVAPEVAEALTAGGSASLQEAVDTVLRAHVAAQAEPAPPGPAPPEAGARPFWLDREEGAAPAGGGDIEDELRDRVIQRQSDGGDG